MLPNLRLRLVKKLLSVNDLIDMEIFQGTDDLNEVILDFHFSQPLSSLDKFVEGVIRTYFQENVHIFVVFKDMFKLNNMVMIE